MIRHLAKLKEEQRDAVAGKDFSPGNIFNVKALNRIREINMDSELANFDRENFPKGKIEILLKEGFEDSIGKKEFGHQKYI